MGTVETREAPTHHFHNPILCKGASNFVNSSSILRVFLAGIILRAVERHTSGARAHSLFPKRLQCKERTRHGTQNKSCDCIIMYWGGGGWGSESLVTRKAISRR